MLLEVTNKLRVYEEAPLEVGCNNPEAQDSPVIEGIDENTGDVEEATDSDESDSDGEDETGIRKFVLDLILLMINFDFWITSSDLAVQGMESLALSFMTQLAKAISLKIPETQDDDSQKTMVAKSSLTKRRIVLELADRNKAKGSDGYASQPIYFSWSLFTGATEENRSDIFNILETQLIHLRSPWVNLPTTPLLHVLIDPQLNSSE